MLKCQQTAKEKASKIKLAIFDVDGVLTDGKIYFTEDGSEYKAFHSHDGMGMKMLLRSNIDIAIITARNSKLVAKRMSELGVKYVYQGQENKLLAYEALKEKLNLNDDEIAYTGDDLNDLGLIRRSGLGIAVANASPIVHAHANWCTTRSGGAGAVREVCEFILAAQNTLEALCEQYM